MIDTLIEVHFKIFIRYNKNKHNMLTKNKFVQF